MATQLGELVPVGGGDSIPMLRETMTVGRRKSNDICLEFSNVSSQHCEFSFRSGVWYVRDLRSQNGTKVNGERIMGQKILKPGDAVAVANHQFKIQYHLTSTAASFIDESAEVDDTFSQSLLEKAGLSKPKSGDRD
jgi:pSer/pThr/pTyr-binding forkhead associated (FHA) protein